MPPKPRLTHFLCLPLSSPASRSLLEHGINSIRAEVSQDPQLAGLVPAVRPVGALHLTVGMMSLLEPRQVELAIQKLDSLDIGSLLGNTDSSVTSKASTKDGQASTRTGDDATQTLGTEETRAFRNRQTVSPIYISLQSISSMHNARKTSILYTDPLDESGRLYAFCQRLRAIFDQNNLLVQENRPLKLHMTVMNSVYAETNSKPSAGSPTEGQDTHKDPKTEGRGRRRSRSVKFDARELIESLNKTCFVDGELKLEKLAICRMGAEKIHDETGRVVDERYEEIAVKALPT